MLLTVLGFFRSWRVMLGGVAVLAVICIWAYVTHLQHVARARKAQLEQAAQQVQIQTATTKAIDTVATKSAAIEERTHVIVRTVQSAPGANTPVPAGVLAAWSAGLSDDQPNDPAY